MIRLLLVHEWQIFYKLLHILYQGMMQWGGGRGSPEHKSSGSVLREANYSDEDVWEPAKIKRPAKPVHTPSKSVWFFFFKLVIPWEVKGISGLLFMSDPHLLCLLWTSHISQSMPKLFKGISPHVCNTSAKSVLLWLPYNILYFLMIILSCRITIRFGVLWSFQKGKSAGSSGKWKAGYLQRRKRRPSSSPSESEEDLSASEPKQCYGPGCTSSARPHSKYCSDECGIKLATARIYQVCIRPVLVDQLSQ